MNIQRTYTMRARADGVAHTREQILEAAMALSEEKLSLTIGLADVAGRAGVTVRTVLRHFGSRDGLFEALSDFARRQVLVERDSPPGDTARAAHTIVSHYEHHGDRVMRMLEEESLDERVARHVAQGRRLHRDWVRDVFAPQLAGASDPKALEDLLVVATDVYTWKLLRRDAGLSRARTEARMLTLIRSVVGEES
jgi:AcrR family transcriptional regulator